MHVANGVIIFGLLAYLTGQAYAFATKEPAAASAPAPALT
jgi:hypothetical protein